MVGPSSTEEEDRVARLRLKVFFVLLVGASGGLVAVQAGASRLQVAGGVAGGLVVGALLLAWLVRWARQFQPVGRRP